MALRELRLHALEIKQGKNRKLYCFAIDGKQLGAVASISRVRRSQATSLEGYQRPEVISHIGEIRRYLESENPLLPNAVVVAFDNRVRFEPASGTRLGKGYVRSGLLIVPVGAPSGDCPGWIVDGQQRSAAIRDANIDAFPIAVTAFIADSEQEQKEQFILVNSTKPLPKGLIHELLPTTRTRLPRHLQRRRFAAYLLERLNYDVDSPMREMIQTPTNPKGVIKDNSVLRMLDTSLNDGALHAFRDPHTGEGDVDSILSLLKPFWDSVRQVFVNAWGLPPRKSRLMHGVGISSMGFVMDAIADPYVPEAVPSRSHFVRDLEALRPLCHWTEGCWRFRSGTERKWNELQNTPSDIQLLTGHLLNEHRRVTRRARGRRSA